MLVTCPFCHNDTMAGDFINVGHLRCVRCGGFGIPPTAADLEKALGHKLFNEHACARLDCDFRGRCPVNCKRWKAVKVKVEPKNQLKLF
jgi:hypothetical protein